MAAAQCYYYGDMIGWASSLFSPVPLADEPCGQLSRARPGGAWNRPEPESRLSASGRPQFRAGLISAVQVFLQRFIDNAIELLGNVQD